MRILLRMMMLALTHSADPTGRSQRRVRGGRGRREEAQVLPLRQHRVTRITNGNTQPAKQGQRHCANTTVRHTGS